MQWKVILGMWNEGEFKKRPSEHVTSNPGMYLKPNNSAVEQNIKNAWATVNSKSEKTLLRAVQYIFVCSLLR